ncbi:ADP-ribosylation/Crystallin J1 [Mycena olivaceomarginata]|nr:ADP-ribosylation/Crystallin J1 [Mycena olivaceomarginata]
MQSGLGSSSIHPPSIQIPHTVHTTKNELTPLHLQPLAPAAPHTKIRLTLLAKAVCDALGGPVEFHPRFKTLFVAHMAPNDNFSLPARMWTDDTSMALALARSITTFDAGGRGDAKGKTEEKEGGDKGNMLWALFMKFDWEQRRKATAAAVLPRIARDLGGSVFGWNGSLMRVLPVGLTYQRKEEGKVGDLAKESSGTTHPNAVCQEVCAAWAMCVTRFMHTTAVAERMQEGQGMMKLDVLHHFASYPYTTPALQEALVADVPLPPMLACDPRSCSDGGALHRAPPPAVPRRRDAACFHRRRHSENSITVKPLCFGAELLTRCGHSHVTITNPNVDADDLVEARMLAVFPQAVALPSSGYDVHTLAAALYAFLTNTFEAGVLLTANMGDNAPTETIISLGRSTVLEASFDPGQRQGGVVRLGEEKTVEENLVEPRIRQSIEALERTGRRAHHLVAVCTEESGAMMVVRREPQSSRQQTVQRAARVDLENDWPGFNPNQTLKSLGRLTDHLDIVPALACFFSIWCLRNANRARNRSRLKP